MKKEKGLVLMAAIPVIFMMLIGMGIYVANSQRPVLERPTIENYSGMNYSNYSNYYSYDEDWDY